MQSFDVTSKDHDIHDGGKIVMVHSGTSFDDMQIVVPLNDAMGIGCQSSKQIILLSEAQRHRQQKSATSFR